MSVKKPAKKPYFIVTFRTENGRTLRSRTLPARELPDKWRLRAHLCVTEGLKDDRAKHRAIVYGECAEQLEAALRLTATGRSGK
jgi:hypothetical protein